MCAWLQIAQCDPRPDEHRDRALIAQYLDPRTFLMWLRSMLTDNTGLSGGGDWDEDERDARGPNGQDPRKIDHGWMPTIEDILGSWARDQSAFAAADKKVTSYLSELELRADQEGKIADAELLRRFARTWRVLAMELQ